MSYDGPNSGIVKEIEVDVGYSVTNKNVVVVTVVDSEILPGSKIVAVQSGVAATGKDADENELDYFIVNANPAPEGGSMTLNIIAIGSVTLSGKYKIHYVIG
jgi:hypothetical protein